MGDYFTMAACACALIRLGMIHVVLTWGTNNMTAAQRENHVFTSSEIYQREIGSKLSIANRVFYNSYECNPFYLYWQVLPDPGPCAQAQLQLIVLGVLNIVTDFMLLIMPLPVIFKLKAPLGRKVQLLTLFTLGIFIIAITVIRLPINSSHPYSQVNRTTWASTELLTAAIVVNAPTLYSFWNKSQRDRSTPREQGQDENGKGGSGIVMETIGGSNLSNSGGAKRKPSGGILQTKEVSVTEYRHSGDYIKLADERDHQSQRSS
ncbi:pth11-like integral membrane [Trichoderma arundinaceum]|uniref:Pth11-like integral membrane n=1 Tax=Trichoderma arundinaceum TaxID=490622 RepID=A0A395NVS6_TRIAR|nr:pth11-like integral membrane [Trichoderma arundinaceum]